jgi:hypothetical protein
MTTNIGGTSGMDRAIRDDEAAVVQSAALDTGRNFEQRRQPVEEPYTESPPKCTACLIIDPR